MRAVVFEDAGRLGLVERPELVPGPKQVLIETAAVGVCGTDIHVFDGEFEGTVYPLVPGHEIVGEAVRAAEEEKQARLAQASDAMEREIVIDEGSRRKIVEEVVRHVCGRG